MAITQISPRPPAAPDVRAPGGGLHDAPVLLIQLQDDLARSRLREAFWISIVLHLLLVIAIVTAPKFLPPRRVVALQSAEDLMRQKELTFLELPPDAQKVAKPPETNTLSDKDRIATSRTPTIDRKTLQELREWRRAGAPGAGGQPAPPLPPVEAQANPAQNQARGFSPPGNQTARLEAPPEARSRSLFGAGALSPGSAIEQAARASAGNRGFGGAGGDYGMGPSPAQSSVGSNLDILSDTMGVDFGPYLARVIAAVRMNWYAIIPEVARAPMMKKGKVMIEFAILKDGQVAGMRLTGGSGDVSLDRAAWGGITASNPFPPLPSEFRGDYLALRFHFYYNPDRGDLR
jgi:TonB family protein